MAATLYNPDHRPINRWVTIFGFTLQPVELAKLAVVFFLADRLAWLRSGGKLKPRQLAVALALGPLPLVILLVLQPNFGNVMTIAGVTLVLLFIAGVPGRLLGLSVAIPILGGALAFCRRAQVEPPPDGLVAGTAGRRLRVPGSVSR